LRLFAERRSSATAKFELCAEQRLVEDHVLAVYDEDLRLVEIEDAPRCADEACES
jgi:hypothetical protein